MTTPPTTTPPATPQSAPQPAGKPTAPPLDDPALAQIKQQVEAKLPAQLRRGYLEIVTAGMAVLYSPQTQNLVQQKMQALKGAADPAKVVADGTLVLMKLLYKESRGAMSLEASFPAAITLMAYIMEDAEKMLGLKFDPRQIATATLMIQQALIKFYRITPEMVQQAKGLGAQPGQAAPAAPGGPPAQRGVMAQGTPPIPPTQPGGPPT